jgi:DNA-binding XRE family transcriptional regulator
MGRKPKSEEPVYSRLEAVRVDRGITRQELADAVDVHYQTIGYLERGEYSPSLALALRIAQELATPVGDLFSLTPFTDSGSHS